MPNRPVSRRHTWLLVGAAAPFLVPLAVGPAPPAAWCLAGAALVAAAALPFTLAWGWLAAVGGVVVYLGAAASAWSWGGVAAGGVALLLLQLAEPPSRRALWLSSTAAVAVAIGLGVAVLQRSSRQADALTLGRLSFGLVLGAGFWLVATKLQRETGGAARAAAKRGVALLVAVAALVGGLRSESDAAIPAWRRHAARLAAFPASAPSLAATDPQGDLEALRAAGFGDAGLATVALGLHANADPDSLRRWCPRRHVESALPPAWDGTVQLGELVCEMLGLWPEVAAERLWHESRCALDGAPRACRLRPAPSPSIRAELLRLRADVLAGAGRIEAAAAAYLEAAAAGDRWARRDGVQAMLERNRGREAASLADASDPLAAVWLGRPVDPPRAWQAWNESLDFARVVAPRRSGLQPVGAPGQIVTFVDPVLARRVATSLTKYVLASGMQLPPPPAGEMPAVLKLWFRARRGFAINLVTIDGPILSYGCADPGPEPGHVFAPLPRSGCDGEWTVAALTPRELSRARLSRLELMGEYSVASIEALPPADGGGP